MNPPRTDAILFVLAHQVPLMAEDDIVRLAATAQPRCEETSALRHLYRLQTMGWVARQTAVVRRRLPLDGPLVEWVPGAPAPDFDRAAFQCRARWRGDPISLPVWYATSEAATELGGVYERPPAPAQITHDVHVAMLYLAFLAARPVGDGLSWVPEAAIKSTRSAATRIPDALLVNKDGDAVRAVEFGGTGRAQRLARLHAYAERHQIAYEVW